MKVAINQPYFFPYLRYYQVMHAVDVYVFSDLLQYTRGGYGNRCRILTPGGPLWITAPVKYSPHTTPSGEKEIASWNWPRNLLANLQTFYRRARCFEEVYALVKEILSDPPVRLAELTERADLRIARLLGIQCAFTRASRLNHDRALIGATAARAKCQDAGGTTYVNREEGRHLYAHEFFEQEGLKLKFFQAPLAPYPQFSTTFVPGMSVLDFLMHVPPGERQEYLDAYTLTD